MKRYSLRDSKLIHLMCVPTHIKKLNLTSIIFYTVNAFLIIDSIIYNHLDFSILVMNLPYFLELV